ncbi:DUF5810 domain-containing protein [Halobellus captivus]|uniref:DUF5810 domain-containing protein n=1 Tax=Halobellus captivus TaxID=2592614 RepID=UPI001939FAAC|nr:DUF5810 domain-containing protein [Halobellus captivus]
MGFACPVCESPQQDATHLANHLAFTAMVHGDEHEAWLDEHVLDWAANGEAELAPKVADMADEADYEQVFEDTVHGHGSHSQHGHDGHRQQHDHADVGGSGGIDPDMTAAAGSGALDEETRAILEEARSMTAEMLDRDSEGESAQDPEADVTQDREPPESDSHD